MRNFHFHFFRLFQHEIGSRNKIHSTFVDRPIQQNILLRLQSQTKIEYFVEWMASVR